MRSFLLIPIRKPQSLLRENGRRLIYCAIFLRFLWVFLPPLDLRSHVRMSCLKDLSSVRKSYHAPFTKGWWVALRWFGCAAHDGGGRPFFFLLLFVLLLEKSVTLVITILENLENPK